MPALDDGRWVVCDRFTDATFAYQGYGRQLDLSKLEVLESWVQADLQPDLTVYLDLDPAVAELRIADREKDRMDKSNGPFLTRTKVTWRERQDMTAFRRWMHLSLWHRLGNS